FCRGYLRGLNPKLSETVSQVGQHVAPKTPNVKQRLFRQRGERFFDKTPDLALRSVLPALGHVEALVVGHQLGFSGLRVAKTKRAIHALIKKSGIRAGIKIVTEKICGVHRQTTPANQFGAIARDALWLRRALVTIRIVAGHL